jgi:hypothetical protein
MNHPIIKFVLENPWVLTIFAIFIMLEVILKYISLWRSARNDQLAWFVVLCIFNTLGILPIIYLIWFGKKKITGATV